MTTTSNFISTLSALAPLIGSPLGNARRVAKFPRYSLAKSLSRFLHTPADSGHNTLRFCQYHCPIDSPEHIGSNFSIAADSVGRAASQKTRKEITFVVSHRTFMKEGNMDHSEAVRKFEHLML